MVAVVVVVTFVVLLLAVLVAGLLRSHADILRSLYELGVGVGDPAGTDEHSSLPRTAPSISTWSDTTALRPASTVAGVTPAGDARAIAVNNTDGFTLLAFLSSGCATCAVFWETLQAPDALDMLPDPTRVAIVTKGPDRELPSEVGRLTTGSVPVVMSTEAWLEYEVPGSPFFVLVDGSSGAAVGQGVALHVDQLFDLIRRAEHDRTRHHRKRHRASSRRSGPEREADADEVLQLAGIRPGDPSLYPETLRDVFPFSAETMSDSNDRPAAPAE